MKNMKKTLSANQINPGIQLNGGKSTGGSQPPRNRIVAIAHMVVIATYSPSMNSRYGVEPYSVMKPATSSDSASTRSNGGAAGFRQRRDIEYHEHRKQRQPVPAEQSEFGVLRLHHVGQVQRAHAEQHRDDHEPD